jgi:adenylate cyclase
MAVAGFSAVCERSTGLQLMATETKRVILSDRSIRKARLGSGLVIFVFVLMHLGNHSLGLISIAAAEDGRRWFLAIWRNPLGTILLYGALVVHMLLVLRALYVRRTLVMPPSEMFQTATGLLIPLLLVDHVLGTRVAHAIYGFADNYHAIVRILWVSSPANGVRQTLALVVVWIHGCIGVHLWLRYRSWYTPLAPAALSFAIVLPILALLGFATMGRTVAAAIEDERGYPGGYYENTRGFGEYEPAPLPAKASVMFAYRAGLYGTFGFAVVGLFAFRAQRRWRERPNQLSIRYPGGEIVRVPRGFTVLEASRLGGIPHYSVCGGKGQCSTCRVQVVEGAASLPPPEAIEQRTLDRIGATADVRLACQLRPTQNIGVVPLLAPAPEATIPVNSQTISSGREREIVVFFCDLRHFTTLTAAQLPFDIVFLLNRYFAIIGRAVEDAGGRLDKFIGDGAMAIFGLRHPPEEACRQALKAAAQIVRDVDRLDEELTGELSMPLRLAIGIHAGPAVVGSMGYGAVKNLTAVGDTVNVASRLESVAKELDCTLVFSEPVASLSGVDIATIESREIAVRGRAEPLRVYIVAKDEAGRFA